MRAMPGQSVMRAAAAGIAAPAGGAAKDTY
jgi:hypothetical protein